MSDALSAEVPSAADVARTAEEAARFLSSRRPRRSKPENIMRVAQLDAVQLDQELLNMLRESLQRSAAYLPSAAADRFAPELESLLYLLLWLFSIRENRPSPGNAMQNLRYCNNVPMKGKSDHMMRWWQRLGHGAATVLFRWLWLRMSRTATENAWMDRAESSLQFRTYALMQALEKLYRVCSVVNLVVFLRTGRYRSLLDRVLRMRLVYARRDVSRVVSFEFMNQQLVWSGMSDFLLHVMPLINFAKLRRFLRWCFGYSRGREKEAPTTVSLGVSSCGICGVSPCRTPFLATPCRHAFCYYCLVGTRIANERARCPHCSTAIRSVERVTSDMLDSPPSTRIDPSADRVRVAATRTRRASTLRDAVKPHVARKPPH